VAGQRPCVSESRFIHTFYSKQIACMPHLAFHLVVPPAQTFAITHTHTHTHTYTHKHTHTQTHTRTHTHTYTHIHTHTNTQYSHMAVSTPTKTAPIVCFIALMIMTVCCLLLPYKMPVPLIPPPPVAHNCFKLLAFVHFAVPRSIWRWGQVL